MMSSWSDSTLEQRRPPASRWWLWLCVLHGMSSMLVWWAGEPAAHVLTWRAGETWSRPWTWWSSAWVHLHTPHLIGNQMVIGVFAAWAWLVSPNRLVAVAWLLAWPISTLTLNGWPHIGYCVGLSGVLHAGVVIMGLFMLLNYFQPPNANGRIWGGLLLIGISLKLFSEESWYLPVVWDNAANLSVVRAIHLTGALSGIVLTLAVIAIHAITFKFLYRLRRQSQLGSV